jgi:hypothetical protein
MHRTAIAALGVDHRKNSTAAQTSPLFLEPRPLSILNLRHIRTRPDLSLSPAHHRSWPAHHPSSPVPQWRPPPGPKYPGGSPSIYFLVYLLNLLPQHPPQKQLWQHLENLFPVVARLIYGREIRSLISGVSQTVQLESVRPLRAHAPKICSNFVLDAILIDGNLLKNIELNFILEKCIYLYIFADCSVFFFLYNLKKW